MIDVHILSGRLGNEMFRDAYIYTQMREGNIPDVYVQSPEHFEKYADEIRERYGSGIGMLPYTGIHLRVGKNPLNPSEPSYIDNPFYTPLCKTGYYIKALEHFPGGKFIVFSDDVEFAKTYFVGDRFVFDDSENDIQAFNKLASCQSLVIANSSWSWWAAYLSNNEGKKVICPREDEWYSDGQVRTKVPSDWVQVKL